MTQASRAAQAFLNAALTLGVGGVLAIAVPGTASAQPQLVAVDATYTALQRDNLAPTLLFHHMVKPAATEPANWVTPIDYSKGVAYFYIDVMEKPSAQATTMTVCFDGDLEAYGCVTSAAWTTTGVHESMKNLVGSYQYSKIQWTKRRTEYHLIIKDGSQRFPNPAADWVPTKLRLVMTIVPPGGTYVRPVGAPPIDGGASDAGSGASDAGRDVSAGDARADAGGGSGGSSGTGAGGSDTSNTGGSSANGSGGGGSSGSSGGSSGTTTSTGGTSGGSSTGGSAGSGTGAGGSTGSSTTSQPKTGGCSVATGAGSGASSLWLLSLAGLALVSRRRRSR